MVMHVYNYVQVVFQCRVYNLLYTIKKCWIDGVRRCRHTPRISFPTHWQTDMIKSQVGYGLEIFWFPGITPFFFGRSLETVAHVDPSSEALIHFKCGYAVLCGG